MSAAQDRPLIEQDILTLLGCEGPHVLRDITPRLWEDFNPVGDIDVKAALKKLQDQGEVRLASPHYELTLAGARAFRALHPSGTDSP